MRQVKKWFALLLVAMLVLTSFPVYADELGGGDTGDAGDTVNSLVAPQETVSYVRLKNKWQSNYLYESSNGLVRYGLTRADDQTSHWTIETVGANKRIKNRATGHYITTGDVAQRRDALTSRDITVSTVDDQWVIETSNREGFMVIKSARDPSANLVIHEEDQLGFAEASADINVTFESPQWALEPVSEDIPVRLLNQYRAGQYLYEDKDGFVKFGEIGATNQTSHWYLDVQISNVDGTRTIRIRNRASGHYITQGVDWTQIKSLVLDTNSTAKSEWIMTASADPLFFNFKNREALEATTPLTYVLNTQEPSDKNARSNTWAQPEWGSALWKVEIAPEVTPLRIVNFTNEIVGNTYLFEDNGKVKYGPLTTDIGQASLYQWFLEESDGAKRIRNLSTGHYITSADPVEALALAESTPADRWNITPSNLYDDYTTIQSVAAPDSYLHVTGHTGFAQSGIALPDTDTAQWLFEDPALAGNGSPVYVRIQNEWQSFVLYEDEHGELKYGNAAADDHRAQWLIEKFEGRKRIKNRATGHYINIQSMAGGHIRVSDVEDSWASAKWVIEDLNGTKLIHSVQDPNNIPDQQKYISLQNLTKYAEYSVINRGWGSPRWKFNVVADSQPTNFRFKNKVTGQYLYEVYSDGDSGELKYGDVPADDTSSIWFEEDTGDGVGTYRLKNVKSGNYISMEHFGGHETEDAPNILLQTIKQIYPTWGSVKWYVSAPSTEGYINFRSGWTGEHYIYADDSGGLKLHKNFASVDSAQFAPEAAVLPEASLPTGEIRIKSVSNSQYLYENASGVAMYGNIAASNGYSHWSIETDNGVARLKNRVTGHYLKVSGTVRFAESLSLTDQADPAFQWSVEHSPGGSNYFIRSLNGSFNDEYLNVQSGAGYAERGLYPSGFGSVQWAFEDAPEIFEAPSWDSNRNTETSTPIQDDTNYIRILSNTGSTVGQKVLYENGGKLLLGSTDFQDASAQWLVQDFNGRMLLKNRNTGNFAALDSAGKVTVITSESNVLAQWTFEERLGTRLMHNAGHPDGSVAASGSGLTYESTTNLKDEMWSFEPVLSNVKYEAEEVFVGGGVQAGQEISGYTGTGYAKGFTTVGGKVSFAVNAQSTGSYQTVIRYRNTGTATVTLNAVVNGLKGLPIQLSASNAWMDVEQLVNLRSGMNSVALEVDAGGSSDIAIDYLVVKNSINKNYRGATVPYTTYEAEHGTTNGTLIGPSRTYLEVASEASGRQAVRLDDTGEFVEYTLAKPANSIVVRYSIPDSADGAGLTGKLALYVNGVFKQYLSLSSKHAWEYGSYPWSNDPNQGSAHRFFDEMHALIGDVPAGATIRLEKDASSTADYYIIDLADMEQVEGPYEMPDGFVSLLDQGAVANDGIDDTVAFRAAMAAAKEQHTGVWIPQGVFEVSDGLLNLDQITIRGAGMWYTTLKGAKFIGKGTNIQVYDFLLDGEINIRDDEASTHAFEGAFGLGSVIQNVWVEHSKTGLWLTKLKVGEEITDGLYMMGLRLRDLMADGVNFCVGTSNSMMEQSDIRYPGDDGIAMWSNTVPSVNNTARFNTVQLPWLADNIVVFGGRDNKIQDNIAKDTIVNGAGIAVSTRFNPVPFSGTTIVERNTMIRTGSYDTGYGLNLGALWLFASDKDLNGDVIVRNNVALDSTYEGVLVHGTFNMDNVLVQNLVVDSTGTNGIEASSGIKGKVILDNVIVRNERMAMVGPLPGTLTLTEVNNGLASLAKPFHIQLDNGGQGPLVMTNGETRSIRVWNAAGVEVTTNATLVSQSSSIASIIGGSIIQAVGVGKTTVTIQVGPDSRVFTLEVLKGAGGSISTGGGINPVIVSTAENDKKLTGDLPANQSLVFETDLNNPVVQVTFTVQALQNFAGNHPSAYLVIQHGDISYKFPAALVNKVLKDAQIGDLTDVTWEFKIKELDQAATQGLKDKADAQGLELKGTPVDFSIILHAGTKEIEVHSFGTTYVDRTIAVEGVLNSQTTAVLTYDPVTGKFTSVPALFTIVNGKTVVTIRSVSNSIYLVAVNEKTFTDIVGHWAQEAIELLASKQILNGVSTASFAPQNTVTRAEFAAMIVRALGLRNNGAASSFTDVPAQAWYEEAVTIASQYGLVQGYSDHTFRPELTITREQMAVMVIRALNLVSAEAANSDGTSSAAAYRDAAAIHAWALDAVERALDSGIMKGKTSATFAPTDLATRAEAAVILTRLLQSMKLINE
jgi:hypothetical protein